jgi:hypothetical protein
MALTEFPDQGLGGHQHAVALKAWVRAELGSLVEEHARAEPVRDPAALADQLMLVLEGVYATVQALGALQVVRPSGRACLLTLTARLPCPTASASSARAATTGGGRARRTTGRSG